MIIIDGDIFKKVGDGINDGINSIFDIVSSGTSQIFDGPLGICLIVATAICCIINIRSTFKEG